jgi:hypothetical protein
MSSHLGFNQQTWQWQNIVRFFVLKWLSGAYPLDNLWIVKSESKHQENYECSVYLNLLLPLFKVEIKQFVTVID